MSVGSRIKQARLEKGLTRTDLARLLNITPSAVSNYENSISIPRQEIFCELIKVLCVDANYLYQDVAPGGSPVGLQASIAEYEYKYNALDERGRETVDRVLDLEYSHIMESSKK